jgi:hypothetical protein
MSEDRLITPEFIAAQLQRVLCEIRILRDDVDVLAAIVCRLDSDQAEMLDELPAMHGQQQRTATRVRALEDSDRPIAAAPAGERWPSHRGRPHWALFLPAMWRQWPDRR